MLGWRYCPYWASSWFKLKRTLTWNVWLLKIVWLNYHVELSYHWQKKKIAIISRFQDSLQWSGWNTIGHGLVMALAGCCTQRCWHEPIMAQVVLQSKCIFLFIYLNSTQWHTTHCPTGERRHMLLQHCGIHKVVVSGRSGQSCCRSCRNFNGCQEYHLRAQLLSRKLLCPVEVNHDLIDNVPKLYMWVGNFRHLRMHHIWFCWFEDLKVIY